MAKPGEEVPQKSISKLTSASEYYASISPKIAAHLRSEAENVKRLLGMKQAPRNKVCMHCGNVFRPKNHVVSLKPKTKLTKKIRKLQRKEDNALFNSQLTLSKIEERILKRFNESAVTVVRRCIICDKSSKHPVGKRIKMVKPVPQQSEEKLTKSMKRKLKKKKAKVNRLNLSSTAGSDLDLSFCPPGASTPVLTSTPLVSLPGSSSSKSISLSDISSSNNKSFNSSKSSKTPFGSFNSSVNTAKTQYGSPKVNSPQSVSAESKTQSKKSRQKLKHSALQTMLSKDKREKEKRKGSNLSSFLSSI